VTATSYKDLMSGFSNSNTWLFSFDFCLEQRERLDECRLVALEVLAVDCERKTCGWLWNKASALAGVEG
jgi:hypothetical protein